MTSSETNNGPNKEEKDEYQNRTQTEDDTKFQTVVYLAPPPPRISAMAFPVRTRARREKSEWRSAGFSNTR